MKKNRIPPKGHINRHRYWRDKEIIAQLKLLVERSARDMCIDAKGEQGVHFTYAYLKLEEALVAMQQGWAMEYNTDTPPIKEKHENI